MQYKFLSSIGLFVVMTITFSGCVSKDTKQLLTQYAKASNKVQVDVLNTYDDTVKNRQEAAYSKAVRDGSSIKDLDVAEIKYSGQKKILQDLVTFSETLALMASDNFSEKIDENSLALYKSTKSLSENESIATDIKPEDLQLFATLVNASFKSYMEYSRVQSMKELLLLSDKWIRPSIDTLNNGLESWKNLTGRSIQKQIDIKIYILNNPYAYCKVNNKDRECHILAETYTSKAQLYKEIHIQQKRLNNLDKEFKALSGSVTLLLKLHQQVIDSLEKNNFENKESILKLIDELNAQTDSVNAFRNTMEEK